MVVVVVVVMVWYGCGVVWYSMVWYVWCGMVWCVVVWYGMVWDGMGGMVWMGWYGVLKCTLVRGFVFGTKIEEATRVSEMFVLVEELAVIGNKHDNLHQCINVSRHVSG